MGHLKKTPLMKKHQSRNHERGTMNKVVDKSQSSEIKGEQNRPMHKLIVT